MDPPPKIMYLAPEIPGLSQTFVYDELLAVEGKGYSVIPVSVNVPKHLAIGMDALASRVHYLYAKSRLRLVAGGLFALAGSIERRLMFRAIGWLISDITSHGMSALTRAKLMFQFLVAAQLAVLIRSLSIKHLHIHFADVPAQIGMYAAALSGIPYTVTGHANDIFEHGRLLREKAARSKKFITISEFNRAYLINLGISRDQLDVVRCGVCARPQYGFRTVQNKNNFRIGTLGRFVEKKGIDVLIEAIAILRSRSIPVGLVLVIAGDGPLMAQYSDQVSALGLGTVVEFPGKLPHSGVSSWMRDLDLFVLACKQDSRGDMDGIPVALMEAMSEGTPVISTRISGVPELLIHEKTGLLANPDDPMDLAHQIERLLLSSELRMNLSSLAYEHVNNEFSRELNVNRLIKHFDV